ncbi:MAG TPA: hypothetical protein VF329_00450 [Gammaproteobacteria bacterium]
MTDPEFGAFIKRERQRFVGFVRALWVLAKLFFGFGGGGSHDGRRRRRRRRPPVERSEEWLSGTDDVFQRYWREEGKQAYEAYIARKRDKGESDEPA